MSERESLLEAVRHELRSANVGELNNRNRLVRIEARLLKAIEEIEAIKDEDVLYTTGANQLETLRFMILEILRGKYNQSE